MWPDFLNKKNRFFSWFFPHAALFIVTRLKYTSEGGRQGTNAATPSRQSLILVALDVDAVEGYPAATPVDDRGEVAEAFLEPDVDDN